MKLRAYKCHIGRNKIGKKLFLGQDVALLLNYSFSSTVVVYSTLGLPYLTPIIIINSSIMLNVRSRSHVDGTGCFFARHTEP